MGSTTIASSVRQFLLAYPPFTQMRAEDLDFLVRRLELAYFARSELLVGPESGSPAACFIVKQGVVQGVRPVPPGASTASAVVQLTPGEVFPVGALMADRPVTSEYRASGDVFCWLLKKADFDELLRRSDVFLDFCKRRMGALLDLSQQAVQATYAQNATQWRSMVEPLGSLVRRPAVTVASGDSLRVVFGRMEEENVGSVIVAGAGGPTDAASAGIFTRQDVIGRVVLPGVPLDTAISMVMTAPIITMDAGVTVAEAMLLMAHRAIRHIPVTRDGELIGVVTERDLFVLQRQSLRSIGDSIRHGRTVEDLARAAGDIRTWSKSLVAQGVAAAFVTRLISRLNDQVTARLIALIGAEHGLDLSDACWLALGSEGREEQTIATDQDNGLILEDARAGERPRYLAFAQAVNQALDRCGYPLCKGGIMAGNPKWCLTRTEWRDLFDDWIARGDPESLLAANIFFDFRALTGNAGLAAELRAHVAQKAAANSRFLKQMSDNAMRNGPPASWTAGVLEQLFTREAASVDLKLNGTSPFVDGARLLALAHGVTATGTGERFEALVEAGAIPEAEAQAWVDSFQFLQGLRLRIQHADVAQQAENPNLIDTRDMSDLDRRILKEAFRQARKLQQRLALDYPG
jgi:CBS domain-containing protein